ncbi:MAG: helix-turn-helix domain-containing protein [Bacteroidota bacterium]
MSSFSFFDLVLCVGIGQGVFLILAIYYTKDTRLIANRWLLLIIFLALIMLFGKVFVNRLQGDWIIRAAQFGDTAIYLFGPFIYFYVLQITRIAETVKSTFIYHLVPAFLHLAFFVWSFSYTTIDLLQLIYFDSPLIAFFAELIGLISLLAYLVASILQVVRKAGWNSNYSKKERKSVGTFLFAFLGSLSVLTFLWAISFLSSWYLKRPLGFFTYKIMWITTSLFFYVIGFISIKFPSIFNVSARSKKGRLSEQETLALKKGFEHLIYSEKVYQEEDLSVKSLASKLQMSSNDISWFINHTYKKSFYDFINEIRVEAFLEKLKKEEHKSQTLEGLALGVGFRSKTTFNKSFKALMAQTPSDYIKQHSTKKTVKNLF